MTKTTFQSIRNNTSLRVTDDCLQIESIDMHTGGEPLRVILNGFPALEGRNVLERRSFCKQNYDHLRTALMYEPRGHADMYGCILTPPNDDWGDFGIIFMHNEGYSTMCGHATIAIAKLAVEMDWVDVKEGENEVRIDAPCGRLRAFVEVLEKKVISVRFHCVASFVVGLDQKVHVPDLGEVIYDLAYGGAFYAYIDLAKNDLDIKLDKSLYQKLIARGMSIKHAVMASNDKILHPYEADLSFLYGTIFIDHQMQASGADSRNVCVFADGEVDRCPTGSGVSGRMAIHFERGELMPGEEMVIESITGSTFKGSIIEECTFGNYAAVIPQVEGMAYVTGKHTFIIDAKDPFAHGFLLR